LLHKFHPDLTIPPPPIHGRFYVFVDECHRTQGGDMNKQMKKWLENAIFIGFTGTPLLKKDKQTTRDVFGTYIHTYKFHEGVADGVILDLKYEARDVPQRLTSPQAIEAYFAQKTKTLNNFQKAILRKRWATMEELMSAEERKARIVASIIHDFDTKPRLNNDRGTAILVAASFVRAYADLVENLTEAGYSDAEVDALQKEVEFYGDTRAAIKRHSGEELDIKPFEADMRHLLNTYIQADPAADLGNLNSLSLTELIIETGIHDAIARKLNAKGKLSRNAVAEGIINNVRKTIIRDQLTDPKFYAEMSKLLDDLITQNRTDAAAYEAFLKNAEELVKRMGQKNTGSHPVALNGFPGAIVLFNNLASIVATAFQCPTDEDEKAKLALKLDLAMREKAPAGWKGDDTREKQVLNAIFPIMSRDREATQAIFEIIKNQPGY
jgi:type I site-specific restriction-modification system R (restriction) subunit